MLGHEALNFVIVGVRRPMLVSRLLTTLIELSAEVTTEASQNRFVKCTEFYNVTRFFWS